MVASSLLTLIFKNLQHVRRAAVLALSTAAHNKPNLIKGLLPELLPLLYDQTIVKVLSIFDVLVAYFKNMRCSWIYIKMCHSELHCLCILFGDEFLALPIFLNMEKEKEKNQIIFYAHLPADKMENARFFSFATEFLFSYLFTILVIDTK